MKFRFLNKQQIILFAVLVLISIALLYQNFTARGAAYSFFQTDWSGGASTTSIATHAADQTGWTKFFSKDDNVTASTSGQLSLASTTSSWAQTTDADFASGTLSNTYVSSGTLAMKKPAGLSCSSSSECSNSFCSGSVCTDCASVDYGGQTYGAALIGSQCWMTANLNVGNYATSTGAGSNVSNNAVIEKYCLNNVPSNCSTTNGGLYDWDEAMGYATSSGAQGICPPSWHIPTDGEWYELENYLKDNGQPCNSSRTVSYQCSSAGTKLKSGGSTGMNIPLPGIRMNGGGFGFVGNGYLWTSSGAGSTAINRTFASDSGISRENNQPQDMGFSVRCVHD